MCVCVCGTHLRSCIDIVSCDLNLCGFCTICYTLKIIFCAKYLTRQFQNGYRQNANALSLYVSDYHFMRILIIAFGTIGIRFDRIDLNLFQGINSQS